MTRTHHGRAAFAAVLFLTGTAAAIADDAPPKYETGDPRGLNADEVYAVWDTLANVSVPKDDDRPAAFAPEDDKWSPLEGGKFRVRYGALSGYVDAKHAEMAHELGLRAWTVSFTGGPLHVWYDVETTGGSTAPGLIDGKGVFLNCQATEGKLLFLVLPGADPGIATDRSRRVLATLPPEEFLGDEPRIPRIHALRVVGGPQFEYESALYGRERHWWSDWHGVEFERLSTPGPIAVPAAGAVLLDLRIAETNVPQGDEPRSIRLRLRAKPQKIKSEVAR